MDGWMEPGHWGVSILWFWPSFALNPELRKKLAQQRLASLSNPLCTSLSSGEDLSNPFVGIPRARLHAWGQIASYPLCGSAITASKLQQDPFWLLWSTRKKEHTVAYVLKTWRCVQRCYKLTPQFTTPLCSLCLGYPQHSQRAMVFNWFPLLPVLSFIGSLTF